MSDEELADWLRTLGEAQRSVQAQQVYVDFNEAWAVVMGERRAELAALIIRAPALLTEVLRLRSELGDKK